MTITRLSIIDYTIIQFIKFVERIYLPFLLFRYLLVLTINVFKL